MIAFNCAVNWIQLKLERLLSADLESRFLTSKAHLLLSWERMFTGVDFAHIWHRRGLCKQTGRRRPPRSCWINRIMHDLSEDWKCRNRGLGGRKMPLMIKGRTVSFAYASAGWSWHRDEFLDHFEQVSSWSRCWLCLSAAGRTKQNKNGNTPSKVQCVMGEKKTHHFMMT